MEIKLAVAQQSRIGSEWCSDSAEIIPRPRGGVSAALAWGRNHSDFPQNYQTLLTQRIRTLVQEDHDDRMILRAAHDYVYSQYIGKLAVSLTMISADMAAQTILLARNSNCPILVKNQFGTESYDENAAPLGVHKKTRHMFYQLAMESGLVLVCYSEGVQTAARKAGHKQVPAELLAMIAKSNPEDVLFMAQSIVEQALEWASHKPGEDLTAIVMALCDNDIQHTVSRTVACYPYPQATIVKY